MGRQIKSSAITLDVSSMGAAPVAPSGALRVRPKSDGTTLQLSYNGGAYFDLGAGGPGGTPRLDEVLNPNAPVAPPRIKAFAMTDYQLAFQFSGADAEDSFVIESATNAAGSGVVALIRTQGTTSTKAPLRVDANGVVALTVDTAGNVGIRGYDSGYDFNVAGTSHFITTNLDDVAAVEIESTSDLANGAPGFLVDNNQVGTLATNYVGITFTSNLQFVSGTGGDIQAFRSSYVGAPATSNRRLQNIVAYVDDNQTTDITGSYTAFYATQNLSGSASYSGAYRAFYARNPGSTWGAYYGYLAEPGLSSGFGTVTPTATLHASGTVKLDLGSDARGDLYYRSSAGALSRLATNTATIGQVLTVTEIGAGSGIKEPRWGAGGSGSTPELPFNSLQFNEAGALGAVDSSVVTAADLKLGGVLTLQPTTFTNKQIIANPTAANPILQVIDYTASSTTLSPVIRFERGAGSSTSDLIHGDLAGALIFQARVTGATRQLGYLRSGYDGTAGGYGAVVELGAGLAGVAQGARIRILETGASSAAVTLFAGATSPYFQVQNFGFIFSSGTTGSLYYRDASGYFVPSTSPGAADRIAFWDTSEGHVDWLTIGSGLSVSGAGPTTQTLTATGGTASPGGGDKELQYNNSSALDGIAGLEVAGTEPNLVLGGGYFQIAQSLTAHVPNLNQEFFISATSAAPTRFVIRRFTSGDQLGGYIEFNRGRGTASSPLALSTALDVVGVITFKRQQSSTPGDYEQLGYVQCLYNSGGQIELGAGALGSTKVVVHQTLGIQLSYSSGGSLFWVDFTGFRFSSGVNSAVFYQNTSGYFVATNVGTFNQFLRGGTTPAFSSIDVTSLDITGTLPLSKGGTGSGLTDPGADRIMFWDDSAGITTWLSTPNTTGALTISGTAMSLAPPGSGTELQYRNGSAFGAVPNSSVDGAGTITFAGGLTLWTSDNGVQLKGSLYTNTAANAPQLSFLRSRGTGGSKSAVLAGDALFTMPISGEYDSVGARQGGELRFDAIANYSTTSAPTVFRIKTTPTNSITPQDRLVLGGQKELTNATLTDLFTITFGPAEQLALAGEVHLLIVAKGLISGVTHTFVHRRVISFVVGHNSNNNMQVNFTEVQQHRAGGASDSTGLTAISHALNSDGAVGTGTNIPSNPNTYGVNAITYKLLATAVPNMSSVSQLTCYYNIIAAGEATLTLS